MQVTRNGLSFSTVFFFLLLVLDMVALPVRAFDVFWTGGAGSWNSVGNWDSGAVPQADPFEEVGIINNGGTATLNAPAAHDAAGLVLGQNQSDSGTLRVLSGGSINFVDSTGAPAGVANIGLDGTGVLEVQGGGSLSTTSLDLNAGSVVDIGAGAGAASLTSTGNVFLNGRTITRGPGHTFSAATSISFEAASEYVVDLQANTHTPLVAGGVINNVQGSLVVQTSGGYTPTLGTTWDILDGASINGDGFLVDTSALPALAPGTGYRTRVVDGGNGRVMQLAFETFATLTVNTNTGAASISSESGMPIDLVGYSIFSEAGQLNPAAWNSLADQSTPGWEEAGPPSVNALNELNAEGTLALNATAIDLGTLFAPPAEFGVSPDISFEYGVDGDLIPIDGIVKLIGSAAVNNLLLTVDPSTGEGQLKNSSPFNIEVLGYGVLSGSGALDSDNWTSLESQSVSGWDEAASDEFSLNELVPEDPAVMLSPGEAHSLGQMFLLGGTRDLELEFALMVDGIPEIRQGVVQYGEIQVVVGVEGDYNNNGVVDAADYTVWRDNLGGSSLMNEGTGISPGVVDEADYEFWVSRFGTTSGVGVGAGADALAAASALVPEPTSCASAILALLAVSGIFGRRRTTCDCN